MKPRGQKLNEPHKPEPSPHKAAGDDTKGQQGKADLPTGNTMGRRLWVCGTNTGTLNRDLGPHREIWVPTKQDLSLHLNISTSTETPHSYSPSKFTWATPGSRNCTTGPQSRERAEPLRLLELNVIYRNHRGTKLSATSLSIFSSLGTHSTSQVH